ncbi:DUF2637 domain-containing protein [Nonomuraea sp. NPDC050556]|uniref:DUF2637 domain-containing protein n=1 Tax=Nonomuraea sp. NPDC050556 TaxID=3364369 RepID=UPI00379CAEA0
MTNPTPCLCRTDRQRSERRVRRITTVTVIVLAAIAAAVSYRHLHMLAVRHGESTWSAALLPLSVDGMILAASLSLLSDSRRGERGGLFPWFLLILGSVASVAANIAVAHPTAVGRIVAAWPAIALIGGLEMTFRQIRQSVSARDGAPPPTTSESRPQPAADGPTRPVPPDQRRGRALQREAWEWALKHSRPDGSLPRSDELAQQFQRSARWARMVKACGASGALL